MRYRTTNYNITITEGQFWLNVIVPSQVVFNRDPDDEIIAQAVNAIRLIIDETARAVICSSMKKSTVVRNSWDPITRELGFLFDIPEGKNISPSDQFTVELDWGDSPFGSNVELATDAEFAAFKTHMKDEIAGILTPIEEETE